VRARWRGYPRRRPSTGLQPVPLPIRSADGEDERQRKGSRMIDNFALGLSHALLLLAAWRLVSRRDLDDPEAPAPDPAAKPARGFRRAGPGA